MTKKKRLLTGDRPTGALHLGHFVGSLQNRVRLQYEYDTFIMIADAQAITDNYDNVGRIAAHVYELVCDYVSVGIDPAVSHIFIQSMIPELFEMTAYFMNLVTIQRIGHNPTVKLETKQKGFREGVPAGFYLYPMFQVSDILAFKADVVPVGYDQAPMVELTRDVAKKFNATYKTELLVIPEAIFPVSLQTNLLGLDRNKMSKSLNNAIYLKDTRDEIVQKVRKMPSDPDRVDYHAPGSPENVLVFDYLRIFDPDQEGLDALVDQYRKGGVMDKTVKERLIEVLDALLVPIREKRASVAEDRKRVESILREGTKAAREVAGDTLAEIKEVMGLVFPL